MIAKRRKKKQMDNVGKEMYMEHVENITVEVNDLIEERLKEFDITLTDVQADMINDLVFGVLEEVSSGNYANYN